MSVLWKFLCSLNEIEQQWTHQQQWTYFAPFYKTFNFAFGARMLSIVGCQKERQVFKNWWWAADMIVCLERYAWFQYVLAIPSSLASLKSRLVNIPFCCWLTQVVVQKGLLDRYLFVYSTTRPVKVLLKQRMITVWWSTLLRVFLSGVFSTTSRVDYLPFLCITVFVFRQFNIALVVDLMYSV